VNTPSFEQLLEYLKDSDAEIRDRATENLWRLWFNQKGELGLELLRRSQILIEVGDFNKAEELLNEIVDSFPDFAEAWNRKEIILNLDLTANE
jgi:tetratricopeptide (TPR) repeat protein